MTGEVRCAACGERLFAVRQGEWTLAAKMLKIDPADGSVSARCKDCDAVTPIPALKSSVHVVPVLSARPAVQPDRLRRRIVDVPRRSE